MSVTKRISGDYNIVTKSDGLSTGNVTVTTDTFFVNGNMVVGGTATSVTRTDSAITDNMIVINKGETGAGVSMVYSGIEVDRGTYANVQLRYNESIQKWEITNDGTNFGTLTTSIGGAALANVYADSAPTLSANLNILGRTIYDSTSSVELATNTPQEGATGIYVTNGLVANEELINKTKALIFNVLL